ncbi:MAG TPA: hypothetical protein VKP11_01300, partial [Frankiaceae bacterium]|nr:hypothetical protein [Frankiaceae bacterium]
MTDRRSGWPWEIQGTNDPRVSGAAAPIGETYRNVSTSDLFQKFGPGNFDWRLITGTVTAQQTAIVDPARGNDATGKFGDLALSFKTIQAAINAVPTPVDAATARTIWTILVSPGTYDEDLAVDLTHGKKII